MLWRYAVLAICFACFQPSAAHSAKNRWWLFENQGVYLPFKAEIKAAQIDAMALGWTDAFEFAQNPGVRRIWDIRLGKEIPLAGRNHGVLNTRPLAKCEWSIGLYAPVSFHMVEGFSDSSNPVINTDYRFGFALKAQMGFGGWDGGLKVVIVGHQSSHLGDEFSLAAQRSYPDFRRINVTYEFWEIGALYQNAAWRCQLGVLGLWPDVGCFGSGHYYNYDKAETNNQELALSKRCLEPYLGVEWLPEAKCLGNYAPFLSLDTRLMIIFDYDRTDPETPEDRGIGMNIMAGLRNRAREFNATGVTDFYFRLYYGVNPFGQFQNADGFILVGLGLHLDI